MAKQSGWWKLDVNMDTDDLSDSDREHIANLIQQGFTEGEIVIDSEE
jgi:hypothetical protein